MLRRLAPPWTLIGIVGWTRIMMVQVSHGKSKSQVALWSAPIEILTSILLFLSSLMLFVCILGVLIVVLRIIFRLCRSRNDDEVTDPEKPPLPPDETDHPDLPHDIPAYLSKCPWKHDPKSTIATAAAAVGKRPQYQALTFNPLISSRGWKDHLRVPFHYHSCASNRFSFQHLVMIPLFSLSFRLKMRIWGC